MFDVDVVVNQRLLRLIFHPYLPFRAGRLDGCEGLADYRGPAIQYVPHSGEGPPHTYTPQFGEAPHTCTCPPPPPQFGRGPPHTCTRPPVSGGVHLPPRGLPQTSPCPRIGLQGFRNLHSKWAVGAQKPNWAVGARKSASEGGCGRPTNPWQPHQEPLLGSPPIPRMRGLRVDRRLNCMYNRRKPDREGRIDEVHVQYVQCPVFQVFPIVSCIDHSHAKKLAMG